MFDNMSYVKRLAGTAAKAKPNNNQPLLNVKRWRESSAAKPLVCVPALDTEGPSYGHERETGRRQAKSASLRPVPRSGLLLGLGNRPHRRQAATPCPRLRATRAPADHPPHRSDRLKGSHGRGRGWGVVRRAHEGCPGLGSDERPSIGIDGGFAPMPPVASPLLAALSNRACVSYMAQSR